MRAFPLTLALSVVALAPAEGQPREASVGEVHVRGVDGECWSNSQVPCDHAGQVSVEIRTGPRPARIRVRSVGLRVVPSEDWRRRAPERLLLVREGGRSTRVRGHAFRVRPEERVRLTIFHEQVPMSAGADYQIVLEVNGREVRVSAQLSIVSEHPDPAF